MLCRHEDHRGKDKKMAMTECKECGKMVSSSAKKCPHCGVSNPGVSVKLSNFRLENCIGGFRKILKN
jgi:uncharacterized OB-fold protein